MYKNPLRTITEHFSFKLFMVFGIMAFFIIGVFTTFYVLRHTKILTDSLIREGMFQVEVLAHNSRIGVFSENEELLRDMADVFFEQNQILEVLVFNIEGQLLLERLEGTGQENGIGSGERDELSTTDIFEELKEIKEPFYIESRDNVEFWAPVVSTSKYPLPEFLGLEEISRRKVGDVMGFVMIEMSKGVLKEQINELLITSAVIGILFLVIIFFASYLLAKGISRPLSRLTEGVRTIGMGGIAEKLTVETRDEIGLLAEAFNDMSESLKRREEELKSANRELLKQYEQRKILSKRLIDLLERDRDQLAMELHDNIGQILTSLKINLEVIQSRLSPEDSDLGARIKTSRERAVQALRDTKNISKGLKSSILDSLGLVSSLKELFNEIESDTGIIIKFFTRNMPNRFEKEKELAIYRIVQEALNNIIKYAHASSVFINLIKKDERLSLSIEDNGVGFNLKKAMKITRGKGPLGILIMRERAVQLNGEFFIESDAGKGTHLMVEIPI